MDNIAQNPVPPILNQIPAASVVPEPPKKKSYTWLLILILFFLAFGLSFLSWENYRLRNQLTQVIQSPSPEASLVSQVKENSNSYSGKYFSFGNISPWILMSGINQSPATPEVLETASFTSVDDEGRLLVQVGTDSIEKVFSSQDGQIDGMINLDSVSFNKKSGYGGIGGSVFSINLVGSRQNKTYLISFYTLNSQNIEKYKKDLDQILSTFKFTDDSADLQTYTNTQYGFELKYPLTFKALTDKENLYGWPKAIVLFYSGGQSYDLPVEVWDSEAEYQEKYKSVTYTHEVFQKGDKFITLVNMNNDPIVDKIIASFKSIN